MSGHEDSTAITLIRVSVVCLLVLAVASLNMERLLPIVHDVSVELQTTPIFDRIAKLVEGA
jgi:hypothetical protein